MEGIIPLLDKTSNDGIVKGKLENEHIEHWIGGNAMDSGDDPWHKLLQNDSKLGRGIETS